MRLEPLWLSIRTIHSSFSRWRKLPRALQSLLSFFFLSQHTPSFRGPLTLSSHSSPSLHDAPVTLFCLREFFSPVLYASFRLSSIFAATLSRRWPRNDEDMASFWRDSAHWLSTTQASTRLHLLLFILRSTSGARLPPPGNICPSPSRICLLQDWGYFFTLDLFFSFQNSNTNRMNIWRVFPSLKPKHFLIIFKKSVSSVTPIIFTILTASLILAWGRRKLWFGVNDELSAPENAKHGQFLSRTSSRSATTAGPSTICASRYCQQQYSSIAFQSQVRG